MRAALGLLGTGQLSLTQCAVVVDDSVDVTDLRAVLGAIRDHFEPEEDFLLLPGTPLDTLDFTSMRMNLGSKMILDATGKRGVGPGDPRPAAGPRIETRSDERDAQARARREVAARELARTVPGVRGARILEDCLLAVQVESQDHGRPALEAILADPVFAGLKLVAAVSPDVPLENDMLLVWGIFTRFDAARDVLFSETDVRGAWLTPRGRLGIDATWKAGYPEPVVMPEEIVERVDARWDALFRR